MDIANRNGMRRPGLHSVREIQPLIENTQQSAPHAAVCPFCALLCDDLVLAARPDASFSITKNGCRRAAQDFARTPLANVPRVAGQATTLELAVRAAAKLLKRAHQPLFAGLATDVDGMRAAVDLAERCGATLDHAHGEALAAMARLLQTRGWYATTLSELRNRADLVLLVGLDLADRYENLSRRCLRPPQALDDATLAARRIVYLGATPPGKLVAGCENLKCDNHDIVEVLRGVLAALKQMPLKAPQCGGLAANKIQALADSLRAAHYSALAFAPARLPEPRDPALALLCEIVDELNRSGRAALLPLGGDDGGQTAVSTCAWLTGYPLRIRYGANIDYQPLSNATAKLLHGGGADALLWIDAYGRLGELPPAAPLAHSIVLGASDHPLNAAAAVFIPVGTPGLDHAARVVRTDAVVSLPLVAQRDCGLPPVADVLRAIEAAL
jgi:formylmethanofuran dehydrogenase subunit B